MIKRSIARLEYLCSQIPSLLETVDETVFSAKPASGKWSKKEILGHLIDSATNNHHRFVRCRFEEQLIIFYDQDKWVAYNHYQQMSLKHLVHFWTVYNMHIVALLKLIPSDAFRRVCVMKNGTVVTLDFLVNDYIVHLEHHLRQMVAYDGFVTEER